MMNSSQPWRILVVDDEEGIHGITRMIFRSYEFEQRPVELISALSGREAREKLNRHPDIAVVLLDVVMETDHEGLELVEYIRNQLGNRHIRIILRTGHPGYAPETEVIVNYDINDYLSKAELSASRLLTSVVVALRSYRDIAQPDTAPDAATDGNASGDLSACGQALAELSGQLERQGQRLNQLDLSPMARDLCHELQSLHSRLDNRCRQLQPVKASATPQQLDLKILLDQVSNAFLPLARRQGWLLDYSKDPAVPDQIDSDPHLIRQLLLTMVELAALKSRGSDLKLTLDREQQQLVICLKAGFGTGDDTTENPDWCRRLESNISLLCQQMGGSATVSAQAGDSTLVSSRIAI